MAVLHPPHAYAYGVVTYPQLHVVHNKHYNTNRCSTALEVQRMCWSVHTTVKGTRYPTVVQTRHGVLQYISCAQFVLSLHPAHTPISLNPCMLEQV